MRAFSCQTCGHLLSFDNGTCLRCGSGLGFCPEELDLLVVQDDPAEVAAGGGGRSVVRHRSGGEPRPVVRCGNWSAIGCNWLVPLEPGSSADGLALCRSCALTRTRPADGDTAGIEAWARTEEAKRRVVHQVLDRGLPLTPRAPSTPHGLAFDLLVPAGGPVVTGHDDGVITIDLTESDDLHREHVRRMMSEPYRTMVGHLRHEIGHYYWAVLVEPNPDTSAQVRACFGNPDADYRYALDAYYRNGPPVDWPERFVSAYATMHPWEDWAETFAHVLHIEDAVQTAASFGLRVKPRVDELADPEGVSSEPSSTDLESGPFADVIDQWLPLTYALNALNRGMGRPDLYPFVLTPAMMAKLGLVNDVLDDARLPHDRPGRRRVVERHWYGMAEDRSSSAWTPAG